MIYGHSAFQKLFRMESEPEMRFGSGWGSSRRIIQDKYSELEEACVQW